MDQIRDDNEPLVEVIEAAMHTHSFDLGAFVCFMGVCLLEMKRVLKATGSIYLHCDPTASHYLKAAIDAVFGAKNFRNEIVWCYKENDTANRYYPRKHEAIFFYAMGDYTFNTQRGEPTEAEIKRLC